MNGQFHSGIAHFYKHKTIAKKMQSTPVVLRTAIMPFDCYLLGIGGTGMAKSTDSIKIYFVTIPAHKFLHIRNYESIGYFDFWQRQSVLFLPRL